MPETTTTSSAPTTSTTITAAADEGGDAATTTSTLRCRNSYDPVCGPFYWDPEPASSELSVHVSMEPAAPRVGERVVFTVEIVNPETMDFGVVFTDAGDGNRSTHDDGFYACPACWPQGTPYTGTGDGTITFTVQSGWSYHTPKQWWCACLEPRGCCRRSPAIP